MRRAVATLAALASLACATSASAASTWHVDSSKSGTACTQADPCPTIGAAVTKASDGDTIDIAAGAYTESVVTGKRLTFDGAGRDLFVHPATSVQGTASSPAFVLQGGGTIRDMLIAPSGSPSSADAADAVLLKTPASPGQPTTYTLSNVSAFAGLTSTNVAGSALATDPATRKIVMHVSDSDLVGKSGSFAKAVDLDGTRKGFSDGVFTFNAVHLNAQDEEVGVNVVGGSLTVDGGLLEGSTQATVIGGGGSSTLLRHARVTGKFIGASAGPGNGHITVRDSLVRGDAVGLGATDGATIDLFNATVVGRGPNPDALFLQSDGDPVVTNSTNSVLRSIATSGSGSDVYAGTNNGGSATLNASHSAYSTVTNSGGTVPAAGSGTNVAGDPGFVDPANGDFSLTPASPLVDRGDPAAVTAGEVDLAGHKRSLDGNGECLARPDIGAYERPAVAPKKSCSPPPDKVAPVISGVHFKPRKLRAGRTGKLSLTLSEKATLGIVVQRRKGGKWRGFAKLLEGGVGPGPVKVKMGPKIAGHKLRRGRYRVTLRAADAAGNRSKARRVGFRVVRAHGHS